ncbi:Bcr/CflA family efflux MFS transporter [Frigidibacter sp. MR17.24]|uniref:Bcr/CflA family efflux MFS transporter n=1 Tax=Frigidibacter sp. MR17.24 TaxID=3127345 RepID=UPI0030130FC7
MATRTADSADAMTSPPRRLPLWTLVLISFSGTLGMHVFVPALPQAGAELGAGPGAMQLTISLYIMGLAVGQLLYGPLSDRYGRRPPLLAGLALYAAAGIVAASAQGVAALVAARLLQALGGCAGLVLARAMVRDISPPREAAGQLATLNMIVTIGPAVAPLAGGFLAAWLGWRSIFGGLATLGVCCLAVALWVIPETHRGGRAASGAINSQAVLLRDPAFRLLVLGGSCATTSLYSIVTTAPYVLTHQMGLAPEMLGLGLGIIILGVVAGNFAARNLLRVMPIARVVILASSLACAAAATALTVALFTEMTMVTYLAPLFTFTFCSGMAGPLAAAAAMSVRPQYAGAASGLYGFAQMTFGAVVTMLAGLGPAPAVSAAVLLCVSALTARLAFARAIRTGHVPET